MTNQPKQKSPSASSAGASIHFNILAVSHQLNPVDIRAPYCPAAKSGRSSGRLAKPPDTLRNLVPDLFPSLGFGNRGTLSGKCVGHGILALLDKGLQRLINCRVKIRRDVCLQPFTGSFVCPLLRA